MKVREGLRYEPSLRKCRDQSVLTLPRQLLSQLESLRRQFDAFAKRRVRVDLEGNAVERIGPGERREGLDKYERAVGKTEATAAGDEFARSRLIRPWTRAAVAVGGAGAGDTTMRTERPLDFCRPMAASGTRSS